MAISIWPLRARVGAIFLLLGMALPVHGAERAQVVGYFVENGAASGNYLVKNIVTSGAAPLLTRLNYAFGRVSGNRCRIDDETAALDHPYTAGESVDGTADPGGPEHLRGTFHQLQELKRRYPGLKVLISLGGWGQSGGFSSAAEPKHRREFVRSCVALFIQGRFEEGVVAPGVFDGIDIDWEYPVGGGANGGRPEDRQNYTALVAEFRRQLEAVRPGLLLTAALPAAESNYANFELGKIGRYLDGVALMAYDLHWNSEPVTNFHSALYHDAADPSQPPEDTYYADYAVQAFLRAGVPARKLILGVPFYGKNWREVPAQNQGLYQPGKKGGDDSGGYRELKTLPAEANRHYYPAAGSCTAWYQGNFWSYDCPEAMRAKMNYVRQHGLGGVMFWELSQDTADSELLRALAGTGN